MDRTRLAIAIVLATIVMIGWPILMHYIAPDQYPKKRPVAQQGPGQPTPSAPAPTPPPVPARVNEALATQPPPAETGQVSVKEITIRSEPYFSYKFSNQGAVATQITLM